MHRLGGKALAKKLEKLDEKYKALVVENKALKEEITHLKIDKIGSLGGCMGDCMGQNQTLVAQPSPKRQRTRYAPVDSEPIVPSVFSPNMNLEHHENKHHSDIRVIDTWKAMAFKKVNEPPVQAATGEEL